MMRRVVTSHKFFAGLLEMDRSIAAQVQALRCPHCGGPLHVADYPRKPRGVPAGLANWWARRFSFCCGVEGCRKRVTPPSVRFFGRRVFSAVWIVFVGLLAFAEASSARSRWSVPRRRLEVARRTWCRWLDWWRGEFPETPASEDLRARLLDRGTPLAAYRHLSGVPPGRMKTLLFLVQSIPILG